MHLMSAPNQEAPMNVHYKVELGNEEREVLRELIYRGSPRVRKVKRALILLGADEGRSHEELARSVGVGTATVFRTKRDFVEYGLVQALEEAPRPGAKRKLSGQEELLLVATACSAPPQGRSRWTLELLADQMIRLTHHESISDETIRRRLHDKQLKPWQHKMWCIPKVDGDFVARMEDVVELYTQPADPLRPVVCFDESPTQLIGESRVPVPPAPGILGRIDYEYRRNGTANLFAFLDVHRPWRHIKVTDHRTSVDFAHCMRELVDIHYPDALLIRLVLDNLSTHTVGALYEAFPPEEARRIAKRLEFHYTPKHASWLNMVEIELGVLRTQCLDRRIPDRGQLEREVAAWEQQRNVSGAPIRWLFDVERARLKLAKSYPQPATAPLLGPVLQAAA
jgi:transposase